MTDSTPIAVFWNQVAAFNAHDVDAFLATYAVDAEVISGSAPPLQGHERMREHYGKRLATANLRCDVISVAELGANWVVAHELVGDDVTSTEVVATFEVVDGVIRRVLLMMGEVGSPVASTNSTPWPRADEQ